jgi:DNA segregation ATPase FtsK/SpoIIIE-like protein
VFRVSIKATAKKTAHAIGTASAKVYNSVVSHKGQEDPGYRIYSGNGYGKREQQRAEQTVTGTAFVSYGKNGMLSNGKNTTPFVQNVGHSPEMLGPFLTNIPIDGETGFADINKMTDGQIQPISQVQGRLAYKDNEYDVSKTDNASADFGYTTDPLSVPGAAKIRKKVGTLSFLDTKKTEFYDLSQDDSENEGDEPSGECYEVTEERDGSGYDYSEPGRKIRKPFVDPLLYNKLSGPEDERIAEQFRMPAAQSTMDRDIPINPDNEKVDNRIEGIINKRSAADGTPAFPHEETHDIRPDKKVAGRQDQLKRLKNYVPVPTRLLSQEEKKLTDKDLERKLRTRALELEETLQSFGINSKVINITHGPTITRFELTIEKGTKVSSVTSLQNDIMLAMAAKSIRIEAPIPGESAIGIEIPNKVQEIVYLRPLVETAEFKASTPLTVALGRDIPGRPIYCDIAKMPHMMIAGSTGSGKSVCINSILISILVHASPLEVRMILIDPKMVELPVYNGIPHLIMPVITDSKKAAGALNWAVVEMQRRYKLFEKLRVKDIKSYNTRFKDDPDSEHLPLILIVIDELAELMMVAAKEVEVYISRLAALARAAGIHLLIATQRPDVHVITGSIKANIGSRIAFAVASGFDSRTILNQDGAEKLLGRGDMLYAPMEASQPRRGQGALVNDDKEVPAIINYLQTRYGPMYDEEIIKDVERASSSGDSSNIEGANSSGSGSDDDELFEQAVQTVIENGSASTSLLQRRLGLGYPRASRLVDELEKRKIIGPLEGSKPRKILITMTEWLEMKGRNS